MVLDALIFLLLVVEFEALNILRSHIMGQSFAWVHILVDLHEDSLGVGDLRATLISHLTGPTPSHLLDVLKLGAGSRQELILVQSNSGR